MTYTHKKESITKLNKGRKAKKREINKYTLVKLVTKQSATEERQLDRQVFRVGVVYYSSWCDFHYSYCVVFCVSCSTVEEHDF